MSQEKSKSKELILSVDAGTQSIRAALVDIEGNILHIVKTPIQPYFSEHPAGRNKNRITIGKCSAKRPINLCSSRKI